MTLECAVDQFLTLLPSPLLLLPQRVLVTLNQARIFHCGVVIRFLRPGKGPGTRASDIPSDSVIRLGKPSWGKGALLLRMSWMPLNKRPREIVRLSAGADWVVGSTLGSWSGSVISHGYRERRK